jgi:hypothetical protein
MNNTADYAYFLMLGTTFMTAVSERIGWLQLNIRDHCGAFGVTTCSLFAARNTARRDSCRRATPFVRSAIIPLWKRVACADCSCASRSLGSHLHAGATVA